MAALKILTLVVLVSGVLCHPDALNHRRHKENHIHGVHDHHKSQGNNVGIIGGHQITIDKVPFMVSLRLNGTYHWCGGSIIHEKYIISAAHCILPNRTYKILVGTDNIDKNGKLYEIEEIIKHENYNNKTCDYDVCLIKLKEPLTFGPKVAKIPLVSPQTKMSRGILFNVTGWGSTGPNVDSSTFLRQVRVPLVTKQICRMRYLKVHHAITNHMICAGSTGHDACQGDSGGPLTFGQELVGITSFGYGCGSYPGVYTKIASVLHWINNIIESH